MPGGGKLRGGRLSVIVPRCHRKVKVSSNTVPEQTLITSANFSSTTGLCQLSCGILDPLHPISLWVFLFSDSPLKRVHSAASTCLSFPHEQHKSGHRVGSVGVTEAGRSAAAGLGPRPGSCGSSVPSICTERTVTQHGH